MFNRVARFSHARILVVDDAVFNQRLIAGALKKVGFQKIEIAGDGLVALEKTYSFQPDLVLLDLSMPNLDGFGYCERVRKDATLPRMPIIVQTAMEDKGSKLRALSCGADDFLNKPLDMDELTLRICGQVERYFILRDLQNMCGYLKMELSNMQGMRQYIGQNDTSETVKNIFDNHYEVLEQLIEYPALAEK